MWELMNERMGERTNDCARISYCLMMLYTVMTGAAPGIFDRRGPTDNYIEEKKTYFNVFEGCRW